MKCFRLLLLCLLPGWAAVHAQVKSPDEFLGYSLGTKFTGHDRVTDYFKYLARSGKNVKVVSYGRSYEGRELLVGIVSAKENMEKLEQIKSYNYSLSRREKIPAAKAKQPAIAWLAIMYMAMRPAQPKQP